MKKLTFFLVTALIAAAPAAFAQVKRVAVVETEVDAQSGAAKILNKSDARQITAVLRKGAVKNLPKGKYEIMTSETVMAQGSAKLEECADENCVITLGSMIGADYIVRGTISKIGTKLTVSVDIYETENGNLVESSDLIRAENIEELVDKAAAACAEMYKTFENGMSNAQKPAALQPAPIAPPQTAVAAPQPAYQLPPPTYQQTGADGSGVLTDNRDGNIYRTLVIGGKIWMAGNLNYQPLWGNSWCYEDNSSNCGKYGRLYDWNTAKTVCMTGWHLPSRQEWDNMIAAAGGRNVAGMRLKARGGWIGNGNGTDNFGFSALPGGGRNYYYGSYSGAGYNGNWWTATERGNNLAYYRVMNYNDGYADGNNSSKSGGNSVRCVND